MIQVLFALFAIALEAKPLCTLALQIQKANSDEVQLKPPAIEMISLQS